MPWVPAYAMPSRFANCKSVQKNLFVLLEILSQDKAMLVDSLVPITQVLLPTLVDLLSSQLGDLRFSAIKAIGDFVFAITAVGTTCDLTKFTGCFCAAN